MGHLRTVQSENVGGSDGDREGVAGMSRLKTNGSQCKKIEKFSR